MAKKVSVRVWALGTNGKFYRTKKVEVSKNSKMAIANLFEVYRDFMREQGLKLKEIYFLFEDGV